MKETLIKNQGSFRMRKIKSAYPKNSFKSTKGKLKESATAL